VTARSSGVLAVPEDESPYEKLRREFEILMGQNNTILRETPAYTIAQLYQLVDDVRQRHNVSLDDIRDEGEGRFLLMLEDGDQPAILGAESPEDLEDLNIAMLDDRRIGGDA